MRFFPKSFDDSFGILDRIQLGAPISRAPLTIVPIQLTTQDRVTRDYIPLADALRSGDARVTEVNDSGAVPTLVVHNAGASPVFLLDGEELEGAKQNRIINLSILVPARTTIPIPVSCVERGRWRYRRRDFGVSPNTMFAEGRATQVSSVTAAYMAMGKPQAEQSVIWDAIVGRMAAQQTDSETEAMQDLYEARRVALEDLLAGLAPSSDQCGAIFAVNGRVAGMELFEFPDMFAVYFQKIVRGYALDALVSGTPREFEAGEVDSFLTTLRRARHRRFKGVGLGDDLRIDEHAVSGGALLLADRVVHLAAFSRRN